ncbi:MAG: ATP-binding cassette domain-containing protein [Planctomycetota bacterium]
MIDVRDLTKAFGSHLAVSDLSFRLERGEVVGFLGPNGAGKTTTMRMLTGYLPPTRGTLRVGGFDVLRQSLEVRKRIGYLPENVPLYREHRVEEMLQFQGRLHGMPRGEIARRSGEVLERVGLADRRRTRIANLSRGLRQRTGLAVALLPKPDVLILDEPTSGLDPLQRIEVRGLIRELTEEHTVLLSSHILAEVEAVCPRVIILDRGQMAADGKPDELVRELGGGSHVRLEAVVPDPVAARELLESLPEVERVVDDGRLGIHHQFDVYGVGEGDLREDLGALAAAKGWALRELSWRRPTLEELFARIALRLEELPEEPKPAAPSAPEPDKAVYNLDPFAGGAGRALDLPLAPDGATETPAAPSGAKTLNPFENFGAASAETKPEAPAPPKTLNPFENFGAPPRAQAEDEPRADEAESTDA